MAEVLVIVVEIFGLLPICGDGFSFIKKFIDPDRRVEE